MTRGESGDQSTVCAILWKLARTHGWSTEVAVSDLVSDADVRDEQHGREVARNQVANKSYVRYHQGKDTIWLSGPPDDQLYYDLRDDCGYTELQIEATFSSYFDGFD